MPDEIQNGQEVLEQKPTEELSTSDQTQGSEPELPEDASDRTREQFEKLKSHNKELSERLKALETQAKPTGSVLDTFKLPEIELPKIQGLSQEQVSDVFSNLVDKDGYIDQPTLVKALRESKEMAEQAKKEAQRAREELDRRTETEQVRSAHKEFPFLDPKSPKFNQNFYNAVRNEVVSQMINGDKDLVKAAKKVAEWFPLPKVEEEAAKKEQQVQQANLTGTNPSRAKPVTKADEDLVMKTRQGDNKALMERLSKIGQ